MKRKIVLFTCCLLVSGIGFAQKVIQTRSSFPLKSTTVPVQQPILMPEIKGTPDDSLALMELAKQLTKQLKSQTSDSLFGIEESATAETDDLSSAPSSEIINKGFGFGISLGYNRVLDDLHDADLSPVDNTVKISRVSRTSFVLSTTVSAPLIRLGRNKNYRENSNAADRSRKIFQKYADNVPVGPSYSIPYGLYVVATVNLLNFSEAGNGSVFNKRIDGGLGLGYRISDDVMVALTYELISVRQPRDFLVNDFRDKQLTVNNEVVTDLDKDDNAFFVDKYLPALSLKLVYQIRGDKIKAD